MNNFLYKYSSTRGVDFILEKGELTFSGVSQLNDPFELGFDVSPMVESQAEKFIRGVDSLRPAGYTGTPKQFIEEKLKEWSFLGYGSELQRAIFFRNAWKTNTSSARSIAILSLSKRLDSLLMWSHYCESHKGLVLGFDPAEPALSESSFCGIHGPQSVRYDERRISFKSGLTIDALREACLVKAPDWKYEEEVRCLRSLPAENIRLCIPFKPRSLREIIIGPQMSLDTVKRIFLLRDEKYPEAKVFVAVPEPSRFGVHIAVANDLKLIEPNWNSITPDMLIPYPDLPPI